MLRRQDRQRLAAIERQMLIDDPAFARRLCRGSIMMGSTWRRVAATITALLCGLVMFVGMLSGYGTLTASVAALTAAACWAFHRAGVSRRRRP
jgi:uncharacterized membrane protein